MMLVPALLTLFAIVPVAAQPTAGGPAPTDCVEWQECRQRTTEALARGDYELAHDLAWRTVQKGPKRSNELLYLLARAQCLSGRAHDALVMLDRLADTGVAADAANDEDFRRSRELPGWQAVADKLAGRAATAPSAPAPAAAERAAPPTAKPPATPSAAVPSPEPASVPPPAAEAAPVGASTPTPAPQAGVVEHAARFMTRRFAAGGLAYDAVSRRFLFGDRDGRKLITAGDGVDHAVDFVRSESAGFYQVMSIEIDPRRGDLWVASSEGDQGVGALHKVQLISGRPLKTFEPPVDMSIKPVDLTVTTDGAIFVLDAMGGHVLELKPRAERMVSIAQVKADAPTSIALGRGAAVAYVSHAGGISRVDLATQRVTRVTAPKGVELGGFERIRAYRGGLIGIMKAADGSRSVIRLQLNAAGRHVTTSTLVSSDVPAGDGPVFATISGDQLSYLVSSGSGPSPIDEVDQTEVIVYRLSLR